MGRGVEATPVGARHGLKIKRLGVNHLGGLHVGPRAQVPPLVADVVDGDWLSLSVRAAGVTEGEGWR